jgi:hypothetical protein
MMLVLSATGAPAAVVKRLVSERPPDQFLAPISVFKQHNQHSLGPIGLDRGWGNVFDRGHDASRIASVLTLTIVVK